LQVGAAGQGDNRHRAFSAFRAARYRIHEILPIFSPTTRFSSHNPEAELLFHPSVSRIPESRQSFDIAIRQ
jgi:hypothetical protein